MRHRFKGPKDWSPTGNIPGTPIWPEFVNSYLYAALWTGSDDDGKSLERDWDIRDFHESSVAEAIHDSNDFILKNREDLELVGTPEQHGHDFLLTRNGHGAGFWDRGYGPIGKRLTASAREYGTRDALVGDDGKLHFG